MEYSLFTVLIILSFCEMPKWFNTEVHDEYSMYSLDKQHNAYEGIITPASIDMKVNLA